MNNGRTPKKDVNWSCPCQVPTDRSPVHRVDGTCVRFLLDAERGIPVIGFLHEPPSQYKPETCGEESGEKQEGPVGKRKTEKNQVFAFAGACCHEKRRR